MKIKLSGKPLNGKRLNGKKVRAFRIKLGLKQTEFWDAIFVTQTGGCRYEKGDRKIPRLASAVLRDIYPRIDK